MVCKRSLYCWKNGPCASDQTRKQIWEDNIRFRESLRDINQSDHYWSFQISKNRCLCLEGEDVLRERPLSRKFRSASLQRLHDIDCTSITHDCNGLKFRNCYVHCPSHEFDKSSEAKKIGTPVRQCLTKKDNPLSCVKYPFRALHKSDEDKTEFCHRYKNTLMNARLKPSMKTKFLSQSNLSSLGESKSPTKKKALHTSCENIQSEESKPASNTEKVNLPERKKENEEQTDKENKPETIKTADCEVQTDLVKPPKSQKLKPVKFPNRDTMYWFSPLSRTTRKMLSEKKKIPFATYGCNNSNIDIGLKRTHNVLASRLEVYPNAISAKQQKRDFLMKYIQSEKEFQKKCLPEELQKRINHSSLWSLDINKKENKPFQRKNSKQLLPVMNKPVKKSSSQLDSGHYRTYRKPQIYFY